MTGLSNITIPTPGAEADLAQHFIQTLPVLVLFPHNRCNCRCLMCDIWRIRQVREITVRDLEPHLASLRVLRVRWVVFSGGEPQMHSDLAALGRVFRGEGMRVTLLTAGLLLESHAREIAETIDDVIISLDGPPDIHDQVRRVPGAYSRICRGVRSLRELRPEMEIRARSTVQKLNHRHLGRTVAAAKELQLTSISFLAADLTSAAFNRPEGWTEDRQRTVALNPLEVEALNAEMEALIIEYSQEIAAGFIMEGPKKLRRIVRHFRAQIGQCPAVAPQCNAPWVSSVIEADGTLRPCFFHRSLGNIHERPILDILNGDEAVRFRRELDVATNPTCQRCVCSLHLAGEPNSNPTLT